tara:strand:+ start:5871 stop:6716 length:846 start_codon:yes stop_codon:yes gene_type:complete
MKTNQRTENLADVRTAIANGFTTKQAKKDAARGLEITLGRMNTAARNAGVSHWDLPSYPHEVGKKALVVFDANGLGDLARELIAVRLELKATEVTKKVSKVDDTTVREMTPQAATTAGIDYIDQAGDRRGYCYCCGRIGFKLNAQGRLSRHGYTRPGYGYDTAACHGTRKTPEQTLDIAILWNKGMIQDLEGLLETDLFAFSIKQGRRSVRSQRTQRTRYSSQQKGSWGRNQTAQDFRNLRQGSDDVRQVSGPKVWRRMLTTQLEQHQSELASLEAVKASI